MIVETGCGTDEALHNNISCANYLSQPCPSDRSGATLQGKYVIAQKQWPTAANEWCPSGYSVQKQIFQSLILGTNINEGRVAGSDASENTSRLPV